MDGRARVCAIAVLTAGLLVVLATPASAHVTLVESQPAAGASLRDAPKAIILEFSQPVEPDFAQIQVYGPSGDRLSAGEANAIVEGTRVELPLAREPSSGAGTYQVTFRVVAVDGDPLESSYAFTLAPPAAPGDDVAPQPARDQGAAAPVPVPSAAPAPMQVQASRAVTTGLWVARLANYLTLTLTVGLLLGVTWLLADRGAVLGYTDRRLSRAAAAMSVGWCLSAVALFVLGLVHVAGRSLSEVIGSGVVFRFVETRLGSALLAQAMVALVVAVCAFNARTRGGAAVGLVGAGLGGFAPAWWGHAGASSGGMLTVVNDWAHVLGATAWVGGLAVLALVVLKAGSPDTFGPARRFSQMAGWALAVVVVTGLLNSLTHLGSLENLSTTGWGRLVVLKMAILIGIVGLGWLNRRLCLPRLVGGGVSARRRFRRMAVAEVGVMLLAFGAAAGLASRIPAADEAAAREQMIVTTAQPG